MEDRKSQQKRQTRRKRPKDIEMLKRHLLRLDFSTNQNTLLHRGIQQESKKATRNPRIIIQLISNL